MSALFVPTRFVWRFGGHQVHLCGSFTRWVETVPMQPVDGHPGVFQVIVSLPPGYHQYKFIVDGEWRHDETQPFMPDPLGNVNNWLFVQKRDEPAGPSGASPQPSIQPQATPGHAQPHTSLAHAHAPAPAAAPTQPALWSAGTGPPAASTRPASGSAAGSMDSSVGGGAAGGGAAPVLPSLSMELGQEEPAFSLKKIRDFLMAHTAYELIPESGKVILLDVQLPIRQAFHALSEQGISSAPLWDPVERTIVGLISASDFIDTLSRLRNTVMESGSSPMSEAEMDIYTIKELREQALAEGRGPKNLIFVTPNDSLASVVHKLLDHGMWIAPVLSVDPRNKEGEVPSLLASATLSAVLATLLRHFRASLASLPLLSQPIGDLPMGTWLATFQAPEEQVHCEKALGRKGGRPKGKKVLDSLLTVTVNTPITVALNILFETGVSCLPVVDERGALVDVFARADITLLARSNAYNQLQHEDIPVGSVLALSRPDSMLRSAATPPGGNSSASLGGLSQMLAHLGGGSGQQLAGHPAVSAAAVAQRSLQAQASEMPFPSNSTPKQRVFSCTRRDTLRSVVEKLSIPGVRRLVVVRPEESNVVEGVLSLCDVAAFLLSI